MKSIGALIGVGLAGLFIGALAMEVIHRVRPNFVKEVGENTRKTLGVIKEAFKDGYYGEPNAAEKLKAGV